MAENLTSHPSISICILTYNRGAYLAVLLDSIATQSVMPAQIVVCDDASTDHTSDIAAKYSDTLKMLIYHRNDRNVGIDENFRIAAGLASGDFIWFLGDDDRLRPDAMAQLERNLTPDLVGATLGSVDYDASLTTAMGMKRKAPATRYTGAEATFSSIADLLGFMSTLVIKKSSWDAAGADSATRFDNIYSQVHRIGRALGTSGQWAMLDDLYVDYRSDNDQFLALGKGPYERLVRDITAYDEIFADLFGRDTHSFKKITSRILNTHVLSRIRNAKIASRSNFKTLQATKLLFQYYWRCESFWFNVLPSLLTPSPVLRLLRAFYKRFAPWSGAGRARRARVSL